MTDIRVAPILPSRDFEVTTAFYAALGFVERARYATYLMLDRDGLELHFFHFAALDPMHNYAGAYVRTEEADVLYAAFRLAEVWGTGAPLLTEPAAKDYGMLEFAVLDPDRNLIRVGRPLHR